MTTDPEAVTDSGSKSMESKAERRNLEEKMMIDVTTNDNTIRDASKTAEPPPAVFKNSNKQTQHGYVLAQSDQSPTRVNNKTIGTDN